MLFILILYLIYRYEQHIKVDGILLLVLHKYYSALAKSLKFFGIVV